MQKIKIIIVFLAFISILQLSLQCDCQVQKDKIKTDIQAILKGDNFESEIKNLQWLLTAYEKLVSEKEIISLNICEKLKKLKIDKLTILDKFFVFKLNLQAQCGIALDKKIKETREFAAKELNSMQLDNLYKAFILTSNNKLEGNLSVVCDSLPEFFDNTGSGIIIKKKREATYKKSPLIYEMAVICFELENFNVSNTFIKAFDNAIRGFLANSAELSPKMIGLFESGASALQVTAANVLQIYKINKFIQNKEFNEKLNAYMNFIQEGVALHLTPQEKSVVFQLTAVKSINIQKYIKLMHQHPQVVLDSNSFELTEKQIEIKAKLQDYYGKELKSKKEIKIKAGLYYQDKEITNSLEVNVNGQSVVFKAKTNSITELGIYTLKCQINQNKSAFYQEIEIKLTTKLTVESLKIDIGHDNVMPETLKHKVKLEQKLATVLQTDQNGFIYIELKLAKSFIPIKPKQVAVRLISPKYIKATNQVIAQYDNQKSIYTAIIDLGDPDQVQAYKGEHGLQIIVADPLLSTNIKWIAATVDIDFKRQLTTPPLEDTDYIVKPSIIHYFSKPLSDPPKLITIAFIGLLAVAVVIFLTGVCNLNLTSDKLFNGVSVFLFLLCIFSYFGVLVLFWVKINIFQTLLLFVILLIPTLITGNFALLALHKEEKQKID